MFGKVLPSLQRFFQRNKLVCSTNNVGYRWTCNTCKNWNKIKVYEGGTSRSARLRGKEHAAVFNKKRLDIVLYKHRLLYHADEEVDFSMEITGVFKDALSRQADEAVRINARSEVLNSRSEFNHPPVARVVVKRKSNGDYSNLRKNVNPGLCQFLHTLWNFI